MRNHTGLVPSAVQLERFPLVGVHSTGVVRVGLVRVLFVRVSVLLIVGTFTPSTAILPADTRDIVVSDACQSSILHTPIACVVLATSHAIGRPVAFVSVRADGVPRFGVVRVGLLANTTEPVHVSSLITHANSADVVAANCESGLAVSASPPPDAVTNSSHVAHAFTCTIFSACPV